VKKTERKHAFRYISITGFANEVDPTKEKINNPAAERKESASIKNCMVLIILDCRKRKKRLPLVNLKKILPLLIQ